MLKKQTVWLLTMLSLIIVLSVYYMMSPGPSPSDQLAFGTPDEQQEDKETETDREKAADQENNADEKGTEDSEEGMATTSLADDEAFAAAKLKKQESRGELKAQYRDVIASESASAEEIAQAQEKIEELQQLSSKEQMLESLIIAEGYKDALVDANGNQVKVVVKTDHLSNEQTVAIINMVKDRLNQANNVAVKFDPGNQE